MKTKTKQVIWMDSISSRYLYHSKRFKWSFGFHRFTRWHHGNTCGISMNSLGEWLNKKTNSNLTRSLKNMRDKCWSHHGGTYWGYCERDKSQSEFNQTSWNAFICSKGWPINGAQMFFCLTVDKKDLISTLKIYLRMFYWSPWLLNSL